ncbi:MAG: SMC-Scp complex subunit ScpB [Lactovum sp.]
MEIRSKIEALLFIAGEEGLLLSDIVNLTELAASACQEQILKLKQSYEQNSQSAFTIIKTAERYRLTTKNDFEELLKDYAKSAVNQSLSKSAQDVLAIIAYKQPVTRLEIDNYRGLSSTGVLTTLRTFGLIEVSGQVESPGRPSLYSTTSFFLDYIGINSLEDLPPIVEVENEESESSLFGKVENNEN